MLRRAPFTDQRTGNAGSPRTHRNEQALQVSHITHESGEMKKRRPEIKGENVGGRKAEGKKAEEARVEGERVEGEGEAE